MTAVRAVAIDLGAGSGRILVAKFESGQLSLQEAHRFPTPLFRDFESGYDCWDLDLIEAQVGYGLKLARAMAPVQSVGIDAWGVDYVLLDQDRRRVGPAISYRDGRTDGAMPGVFRKMPAETIYRRTGIQFLAINTLYQLAQSAQAHPEWLERAAHFLMLPDYLNYRLCGVLANEYTNATTTQLYGIGTDDWDPELLALAGLTRAKLFSPVEPGTVLAEMDRPLGSGQRLAVIAPATHDTASAIAAIPAEDDSEAFISSGTWSLMGFESPVPFADPLALRLNFSNEGGAERRYRVLKNIVGLLPVQQLAREAGLDHATLAAMASAARPWGSLINPEDGRFFNTPSMSGAIRAFCAETGQVEPQDPGSLARCVFESLALCYRRVKGEIELLRGRPLSRIRIVGGGSQNQLLNQLCADACLVPVLAGPVETSALGNACVQFVSMGVFRSLGEAREVVRSSYAVTGFQPAGAVPESAIRRFNAFPQRKAFGDQNP
jgi:rhamnulokinase